MSMIVNTFTDEMGAMIVELTNGLHVYITEADGVTSVSLYDPATEGPDEENTTTWLNADALARVLNGVKQ